MYKCEFDGCDKEYESEPQLRSHKRWHDPEFRNKMTGENHYMYGRTHSDETIAKISKSNSGENGPMYGMSGENSPVYGTTFTHPDETKARMSKGAIDMWKDPEHARRQFLGKPKSYTIDLPKTIKPVICLNENEESWLRKIHDDPNVRYFIPQGYAYIPVTDPEGVERSYWPDAWTVCMEDYISVWEIKSYNPNYQMDDWKREQIESYCNDQGWKFNIVR